MIPSRGKSSKPHYHIKTLSILNREERPLLSIMSVFVIFLLWEIMALIGAVPELFLPPPEKVIKTTIQLIESGELPAHIYSSITRIWWGFFLGSTGGIVVGLIMGISSRVNSVIKPIIAMTYPIPKIAILPLLILWLGIGEASKISVIAIGVFFPLVINTRSGVMEVNEGLIRAAITMGSGRLGIIKKVILPGTLPMIFAGMRLGLGVALLLVVTAEMIAADSGIGFMILSASDLMDTPRLIAGILVLALMGLLLFKLVDIFEKLIIKWK